MPAAITPRTSALAGPTLPASFQTLLDQLAVNPVGTAVPSGGYAEPMLKSLGKPLAELLDLILTPTTKGTGLPNRLRLTNWDARSGNVQFHGAGPTRVGVERFEATPTQLDRLIRGGALDVEQPPQGAVDAIRKKLAMLLGPK